MSAMSGEQFVNDLLERRSSRMVTLPSTRRSEMFIDELLQLLFPHFSDDIYFAADEIEGKLRLLRRNLQIVLQPVSSQLPRSAAEIAEEFFERLPGVYADLMLDADAIMRGDPAAESVDEVISAYPGFLAITIYRIAHEFYRFGVPIFPRIITEFAHQRTGIDIHPGAVIGRRFFIDHGTGIVVGETSTIGDDVKLYQGVTLGALSVDKTLAASKRHPTIENNVVIYSNATILGGETVIGHDSVIGGNVWLTEGVQPFSVVYHKSEVRVRDVRAERSAIEYMI